MHRLLSSAAALIVVSVLLTGLRAEPGAQQKEITSVRELRTLTPEQASESVPVRITGVITYFESQRSLAFVQDSTGGVYFNPGTGWKGASRFRNVNLAPGDLVEISGVSGYGSFAPTILRIGPGIIQTKVLGTAPFPEPVHVEPGHLFDANLDCRWIEFDGVVRAMHFYESRLLLEMTNGQEDFSVAVFGAWNSRDLPRQLLGSSVRARGVFGSIPDEQHRLIGVRIYTPSIAQVKVLDPGSDQAFASEPVPADSLLRYRSDLSTRVHVRGVVTAAFAGQRLFLRSDGIPVSVRTQEARLPGPGTLVDVIGYPALESEMPVLQTALLRTGTMVGMPEAKPAPPSDLARTEYQGELVTTEARLVDKLVSGRDCIFLATDGGRTFSARLKLAEGAPAPQLPLDGWIQFTGICQVEQDPPVNPPEPWAKPRKGIIRGFSLLLRNPADLVVLRQPPFWTTRRILQAAAALAGGLALSFIWVFVLRRKVREQTAIIAAKIKAGHVNEERSRIARELHDTVEQELVGIGLQLDLARARIHGSPERLRDALELALRMLRRTQQETRRSIQDLRSGRLENTDLPSALKDFARQISEEKNLRVVTGIDPLPDGIRLLDEHNLLRIAQEAVNDAVQHSGARNIELNLKTGDNVLQLEIRDDGAGFDPGLAKPGHFGLQGMRERAIKIGAAWKLTSEPGAGTRIVVQLPFADTSTRKKKLIADG